VKAQLKAALVGVLLLSLRAGSAESPQALISAGKADAAVAALTTQLQAGPESAEPLNLLCRAYYSYGDWDKAVAACEKAVSLEPNNARYRLWLGRAYGEKADHSSFVTAGGFAKKLRTEFERAVALDPKDVEVRSDLVEFYLQAPGIMGGGVDKAQAQADALAKLAPAKAHWVLGRIAEKKKDMAAAERDYQAEGEAAHGSNESWLDLAYFYKRSNRPDDMESAIRKASTAPGSPDALVDGAQTLLRAQRALPLAAEMVKRYLAGTLVEAAPAFKAHTVLGGILEKQGDKTGAAEQYRAALALARNYKPAIEGLSRVEK
jgi:tetratricopeptide (TPR) repeat protein